MFDGLEKMSGRESKKVSLVIRKCLISIRNESHGD